MTDLIFETETDTASDDICPKHVQESEFGCNESVCELDPEICFGDDSFTDECVEQGMVFDYELGWCVQDDGVEAWPDPTEDCSAETGFHDCPSAQLPVTGVADFLLIGAAGLTFLYMGITIIRRSR